MKRDRRKTKTSKKDVPTEIIDEDDISQFVDSIKDDGGEMEPADFGQGDDIPTSEISDVIKKLQLDRFKDGGKTAKKQNPSKKEAAKEKKVQKPKAQSKQDSTGAGKSQEVQMKNTKKQEGKPKKQAGIPKKQGDDKEEVSTKTKVQGKQRATEERTFGNKKMNTAMENKESTNLKKSKRTVNLAIPKTSTMLLPTDVKWHSIQDSGLKLESNQASEEGVVASYLEFATKLYDNEVEMHAARTSSEASSQSRWRQTVAKSGVLSDKVAALTLEVQGAPFHTPLSLDALLAMVRKKGRREALMGLDAVKRLLLEELLPSNRKLKTFAQHSFEELEKKCGEDRHRRDKQVLLWFYENHLKQKYGAFLDIIEKMLQDTVSAIKAKALSSCYEMLVNRPEQEKRLLSLIVNKVGDPDYKVAAKAVHWLQKLVDVHSMMKIVVVQAVEELLFRPNISTKAQYYAICFLNQLVLHPEEDTLATQLIIVYLSFFKACTKQKKIDNKMLSAVITGVHRAFPYSKEDEKVHEQLDTLLKVIHQTSFNTSIQALLLVKQVLDKRQSTMDRFYSALYRKLLDPQLSTSPRHAMFLNLLYQTLKDDDVINRVKAFVKRLLQVCGYQQPPFIAAVLVLVSEVIRAKPSLGILNSWNDDSDDEHFMDLEEEEERETVKSSDMKESEERQSKPRTGSVSSGTEKSSWVHRPGEKQGGVASYDVLARNPLHCHVENAVMWELKVLSTHFHPSVAMFATQLAAGSLVSYTGNPLQDFTATRFLDRFVYRNPKQKLVGKESVMQPKSRSYKPPAIRNLPVNSKDFTSLTEDSVPIDEIFFHRFFSQKDHMGKKPSDKKTDKSKDEDEMMEGKAKAKSEDDEEDNEDVGDSDESLSDAEDGPPEEIDSDASSVDDEEFDRILDEMEGDMADDADVDDDIDFAGEFQKKSGKRSKKQKAQDEEDEEEDDEGSSSEDDIDDEEDDEGSDVGQSADIEGLDEEAFEMSDDSGEDAKPSKAKKAKKRKLKEGNSKAKKRKTGGAKLNDVTEQISSMIDENVGSKFDVGLNALANKDKADVKQLRWETERDRWVRDVDPRSRIKAKKMKKPKAKGFKGAPKGGPKGRSRKQKR